MDFFKKILEAIAKLFGKKPAMVAPPAAPSGWTIAFSPGMPSQMQRDGSGRYSFNYPRSDGVHYIYKRPSESLLGKTIRMVFTLTGDGEVVTVKEGEMPARLRLLIMRGESVDVSDPNDRYWSEPSAILMAGPIAGEQRYSIEVRVEPDKWFNVNGAPAKLNPNAFNQTVAQADKVGWSHGGMFAGHGQMAKGDVRFTLIDFNLS